MTTQTQVNIIILVAGFLTSVLAILILVYAIYKIRYLSSSSSSSSAAATALEKNVAEPSTSHDNTDNDDYENDDEQPHTPTKPSPGAHHDDNINDDDDDDDNATASGRRSPSIGSVVPCETERSSTATLSLFRTDPDVFQSGEGPATLRLSDEFGSDLFDTRRSTTTASLSSVMARPLSPSVAIPMEMDLGDGDSGNAGHA